MNYNYKKVAIIYQDLAVSANGFLIVDAYVPLYPHLLCLSIRGLLFQERNFPPTLSNGELLYNEN